MNRNIVESGVKHHNHNYILTVNNMAYMIKSESWGKSCVFMSYLFLIVISEMSYCTIVLNTRHAMTTKPMAFADNIICDWSLLKYTKVTTSTLQLFLCVLYNTLVKVSTFYHSIWLFKAFNTFNGLRQYTNNLTHIYTFSDHHEACSKLNNKWHEMMK